MTVLKEKIKKKKVGYGDYRSNENEKSFDYFVLRIINCVERLRSRTVPQFASFSVGKL